MKFIFLIFALLLIAGCSSEVDKCVSSQVEGWKAEQERIKILAKNLFENPVLADPRTIAEVEAHARLACLKAVGK